MSTRYFPSIPAAIAVGAVGMPLFMLGANAIERQSGSGLLLFLWAIVGFLLPTVAATLDIRVIVHDWKRWGMFSSRGMADAMSAKTFRTFYIPAWGRMAVWFASVIVSSLVLKAAGINL